jgi:hypothetical protein
LPELEVIRDLLVYRGVGVVYKIPLSRGPSW